MNGKGDIMNKEIHKTIVGLCMYSTVQYCLRYRPSVSPKGIGKLLVKNPHLVIISLQALALIGGP